MNTTFELKNEKIQSRRSVIDTYARLWMSACLFIVDVFSIFLAFLISVQIRGFHDLLTSVDYKELFALLVMTLSALFFHKGLYPAVGFHYVDELRHIVSSTTLAYLVLISVTFLLQTTLIYSRFVLMVAGLVSMGLISLNRYLIRRLMIRWKVWGEPALIIGDLRKGELFFNYFWLNLQLGIRPIAIVNGEQLIAQNSDLLLKKQPIGQINPFTRQLSSMTALVLMENIGDAHMLAEAYRPLFHRVILIKDQSDNYILTNLQMLDFLNVIGLQVKNDLLSVSSQIAKRIMDIFGALVGLLIFAPVMGLTYMLIKIISPGPVIYHQERIGKNGVVFRLLKFRTMYYNSTQILEETLERDTQLKDEWTKYQKLKNDPRITSIGRFLRRFSIDELPQLWNVLVGEMSLVGPRPIMVNQSDLYGEYLSRYILVQPGMTGLWQVSGRSETTFSRRASLDREYIERWALWLDVYIIFKTFKIVFFEKNAY